MVLSVVLLGYSLSGYFTNSASPPAGTTTTTTTAKPAVGDATTLSGNVKMEFVQIPSGRFTRGSPANEEGRDDDEGPQHEVTISKPFNLGKYEVTQAQWKAVMSELPDKCDFGSLTGEFVGDDKPIICVSWDDAQRFIAKLNAQASGGGKYRLPTEAEWEYAARAGEKGLYAGNLDEMGWYDGNAGGKTHPAGQKKANAFGLYDMHGNVWEWCGDWYGPYSSSAATDPRGPTTGSIRANRGGGWSSTAQNARSADRFSNSPGSRGGDLGFRVVRE